ncbi:hypothetical protein BDV40DRAFT_9345 [Aspergillus tamarii]|uniref:Uncharacterized protein n=1 Tax=Aspergillus tamarii TaxID=41984 RepID=A0A5N6UJE5_ASPTM|nr:hypothetical protein BDV40DRAFT_9345 [Aspergillus tamarii]
MVENGRNKKEKGKNKGTPLFGGYVPIVVGFLASREGLYRSLPWNSRLLLIHNMLSAWMLHLYRGVFCSVIFDYYCY